MPLPYPMPPVSPFDTITAQETNERIANIEALAAGTGLNNGAITAVKTAFGGNYSTSEVNTGFTYTGGQDIYKRTFTGTITQAAGSRNTMTLIASGVTNIIKSEGWISDAANATSPVGNAWTNAAGADYLKSGVVKSSTGSLLLYTWLDGARTNAPYQVTVYYTKV